MKTILFIFIPFLLKTTFKNNYFPISNKTYLVKSTRFLTISHGSPCDSNSLRANTLRIGHPRRGGSSKGQAGLASN